MFRGRHRRGTNLVDAVALLLSSLAAVAQVVTQTGQITGTVKDPAGAIIAGANVSLKDLQGRAKATAISDSQGVYAFASREPGTYIIEVDAKGFRHAASPNLESSGDPDRNFRLHVIHRRALKNGDRIRQRGKRLSRGCREHWAPPWHGSNSRSALLRERDTRVD